MFKKIKIGTKITTLLLSVVVLSVSAISYLAYVQIKDSTEKRYAESFAALGSLKAEQLRAIFNNLESNIEILSGTEGLPTLLSEYSMDADYDLQDSVKSEIKNQYGSKFKSVEKGYGYSSIFLISSSGEVTYLSKPSVSNIEESAVFPDFEYIQGEIKTDSVFYSDLYVDAGGVYINAIKTLTDESGMLSGYLGLVYDVKSNIYPIVEDRTGLGATGEILLSKRSGLKIDFISPLRHLDISPLSYSVLLKDKASVAMQKAASNEEPSVVEDVDYREKVTVAYWSTVPGVNWGIVVKMDQDEILYSLNTLGWTFVKSGAIIVLFSILVAIIFSRLLTNPIMSLKSKMNLVAKGILPDRIEKTTNDEIGQMASAVQELVGALKRTADFASQIGRGNHDADFKPMSDDDMLGNALITMSDSIQEAEQKDSERNWIVTGVAEIGQILRSHNNLEDLGDEITGFITDKIHGIQGAFYTVDDDNSSTPTLEMKASYAYQKKKYLKASFKFAEGLPGQCAAEQDVIYRTEIPNSYVTVTSGLIGEQKPSSLLLVPLITNEKVYGVLEFAGFEEFTKTQIEFVQEISVIVARTIFNIKVNERTVKLLEESQKMSEELKLQQEILRQNAEEMEATQEELKRTNHRLEDQILEVNRTQKRLQVLLENASEVITIYEKDGRVRYISPSVEPILGYTQDELIGVNDISNVHSDSTDTFRKMFDELLETPDYRVTRQYEYKQKDGQTVWLEATGTNLLGDAAIQGIVINSRDITERRRAEKEERMRSQMQALSENSPDLIKRVNSEGIFFYVNPTIKQITGKPTEFFLSKSIYEVDIDTSLKEAWIEIFKEVSLKNEKVSTEIEVKIEEEGFENRIMQVNAIPEFSEENALESVLLVSHDITESKKAEIEIRETNKKVTESINYAQRIQTSILPDDEAIRTVFPDSFIFYRPRDVVSGDFPWFFQKGDDVYIAAVDCTGHGVPGALISLIGYFILNDIINNSGNSSLSSGEVLDQLNDGVTKTLRQDVSSKTRDGMDIALVKVNKKSNIIQFSGAHRPLYHVSNGELKQVRGDRFPIGGGQYKTRTNFKTSEVEITPSDEVYFFSDGLPDQFGGVDNKKFGNQRIRDLILNSNHQNMGEMKRLFESSFETWKSDKRQTDDILLIGLKFQNI
ncbi:PAS domain S-box protein [Flammeovirgaceae bacterium SG7u.111]|nr:PAS domain S-box protein [Flammeovirgaceae bacterium SG7u.132]WPO34736.1 PAS domain S-box protein [Flammeovirgaceae bacterium SG7u.111]